MYVTEPWLAIATRHQDARAWPATVFHFPQLGGTHPCLAIKKGNFHPFQKLFRVSVLVVGFVVVLGFCCFVCVVLVILVMWGFVCVCWGGGFCLGFLFGSILCVRDPILCGMTASNLESERLCTGKHKGHSKLEVKYCYHGYKLYNYNAV